MVWRDILGIIISVIVISGVFPENGEFEWSIFIYNILGEDDAYIGARINISDESLDKGKISNSVSSTPNWGLQQRNDFL